MASEPRHLRYIDHSAMAGAARYVEVKEGESYDRIAFSTDDPDLPARLAGPELRDVLAEVEWSGMVAVGLFGADDYARACPSCGGVDPSCPLDSSDEEQFGHRDDCRLAAALARARGEVEG